MRLHCRLQLPLWLDAAVAIATVNRFVLARLKGYLCLFAALGARRGEHLALVAAGPTAVAVRLPGLPAVRASLWFIGEPFGCVELLLSGAECEILVAISAVDRFVCETHVMTS